MAGTVREEDGADRAGGSLLPVFRGVTLLALDAKGRLAIPARHREPLVRVSAGRMILTADPSGCLLLYPLAAWEPIEAQLMSLPSFDERVRGIQRLLVGHADDVELDSAGRILVPPALRRYAALDHEVVLAGQGHKFEVWDEAQWSAQTARTRAFPADGLPPGLAGVSL